jgi:hypothetical protein
MCPMWTPLDRRTLYQTARETRAEDNIDDVFIRLYRRPVNFRRLHRSRYSDEVCPHPLVDRRLKRANSSEGWAGKGSSMG